MLLVEPVVIRPWLAEWDAAKAEIAGALDRVEAAKSPTVRTKRLNAAERRYRAFLNRLRVLTVLDPAWPKADVVIVTHWPDLEAALQGRPGWRRVGREYHGPCPVSGAGRDYCFASEGRAGGVAVGCRRCGNGGRLDSESLIAHLAALGGETARHVAAHATNDRAAIETPSPLPARAWGGTGRTEGLRFREGGRGTARCLPAMAFPLPCCFLAGEVFPPFHRHVNVGGLDLDGVDDPPLLLASNDRGARPDERIVDVALVVMDGSLHALNRLLGRVACFRFPGVVDLPDRRGFVPRPS